MTTEDNVAPTGIGQEGAGTPAGVQADIPIHEEGKPVDKLDEIANRAARKGIDREHRGDATIFTK
jgi:hypothetical protein